MPSLNSSGITLSENPNSFNEQIIPDDCSPRIVASLISKFPGKIAPTFATMTV